MGGCESGREMGETCFSGVRTRLVFCSFGERERERGTSKAGSFGEQPSLFVRVSASEMELATRRFW